MCYFLAGWTKSNNNKNVPLPFGQKDNYLLLEAIIEKQKIVTEPIALGDFWLEIPKYLEIFPRKYPRLHI